MDGDNNGEKEGGVEGRMVGLSPFIFVPPSLIYGLVSEDSCIR